jgi:hypothetical protein
MQAPFLAESVVRNSTAARRPRRTSFDFGDSASSHSNISRRSKPINNSSMSFVSALPAHLPAQNTPAAYSNVEASASTPSVSARSYFRGGRRYTSTSTATGRSSSKWSKFSRISSRSSSKSEGSEDSSSTGSSSDHKKERRIKRWGRKTIESLGHAFAAYPQGRTLGVVWYTGF